MTTPDGRATRVRQIPPDLLAAYIERRITSLVLAEKTGMNASYLRRAVKRCPAPPPTQLRPPKGALIAARSEFRMSLADRSATEIANLAHVSLRTAQRIKVKALKLAPKAQDSNEPD